MTFYKSPKVKDLYKQHIKAILNRKNTYSGTLYKDDTAIMAWDVLNEPRCPGCEDSSSKEAHHSWMVEMSAYVKSLDGNHLVTLATEGMFNKDSGGQLYLRNPGAGAQCEGEDWLNHNKIGSVDFTTIHLYERHVEQMPADGYTWKKCDWNCVMNWMVQWLSLHMQLSKDMGKPLLIEETGTTQRHFPEQNRKEWFQYLFDQLVASKNNGGPLSCVMFWNAAWGSMGDSDGYNIYLDQWNGGRRMMRAAGEDEGISSITSTRTSSARHLTMDSLDAFRRGGPRDQCAQTSAASWRPAFPLSGAVDVSSLTSRTKDRSLLAIIKEAAYQMG